jgi:regulator of replication initiation timing
MLQAFESQLEENANLKAENARLRLEVHVVPTFERCTTTQIKKSP